MRHLSVVFRDLPKKHELMRRWQAGTTMICQL
jgi:hypothetical protein